MSKTRPRRRTGWQRRLVIAFTWTLLAIFILTSVGVALVTFNAR